eukprot:5398993-Amphidinium_carterae.2
MAVGLGALDEGTDWHAQRVSSRRASRHTTSKQSLGRADTFQWIKIHLTELRMLCIKDALPIWFCLVTGRPRTAKT